MLTNQRTNQQIRRITWPAGRGKTQRKWPLPCRYRLYTDRCLTTLIRLLSVTFLPSRNLPQNHTKIIQLYFKPKILLSDCQIREDIANHSRAVTGERFSARRFWSDLFTFREITTRVTNQRKNQRTSQQTRLITILPGGDTVICTNLSHLGSADSSDWVRWLDYCR